LVFRVIHRPDGDKLERVPSSDRFSRSFFHRLAYMKKIAVVRPVILAATIAALLAGALGTR
jgi:hypothetical protein